MSVEVDIAGFDPTNTAWNEEEEKECRCIVKFECTDTWDQNTRRITITFTRARRNANSRQLISCIKAGDEFLIINNDLTRICEHIFTPTREGLHSMRCSWRGRVTRLSYGRVVSLKANKMLYTTVKGYRHPAVGQPRFGSFTCCAWSTSALTDCILLWIVRTIVYKLL